MAPLAGSLRRCAEAIWIVRTSFDILRCRRKIIFDMSVIVQTAKKFERNDKFQGKKKEATGGAFMKTVHGGAFDPETIDLLRSVLDEAWGSLRPEQQAQRSKSLLAAIILKLAATGERDPLRLRTLAVTEVSASEATTIAPNE